MGFYVYRFKDKEDNILYVGRTHDLEQRFRQHLHLTDNIINIEYITCSSETDMIIKEIYYINLYFNEKSTNVKDVYDKPMDIEFEDKWIKYNQRSSNIYDHMSTKKEGHNNGKNINDYERIYVIEFLMYSEEEPPSTFYYIGGRDKDGFPCITENSYEAKRYSSLRYTSELARELRKDLHNKLYPDAYEILYDIRPAIYRHNDICDYLFNYYNGEKTRSKDMFFEDQILDLKQGSILFDISLARKERFGDDSGINELRQQLQDIELKRIELRKDPEWEDPIYAEEFIKPYIKNNYNPDKALEELFINRYNGGNNFDFDLHKEFLPEGYICIG